MYGIPALWALALIPLMQLFLFWWDHWSPSSLAHLLGMLCGVGAVLVLPTRVTMRRSSLVGANPLLVAAAGVPLCVTSTLNLSENQLTFNEERLMGIFQRISDILSANMNELTEQFEDPEKMLKQAIREMEDSIAEVTQQTAKAMAHEKTLSRELERNRAGSRGDSRLDSGEVVPIAQLLANRRNKLVLKQVQHRGQPRQFLMSREPTPHPRADCDARHAPFF